MKKYLCLLIALFPFITGAQNIGIGISNPSERFQVDGGNVKIGSSVWNSALNYMLKFGDGDFVHIAEVGDDSMQLKSRQFSFVDAYGSFTNVNITGGLKLNGGSLSIADGTQANGRVLTTNAAGLATWAPPANYNSGFSGYKNVNQVVFSGSFQLASFDAENYDDALALNPTYFTATTAGLYHLDLRVLWSLTSVASSYTMLATFNVSPSEYARQQIAIPAGTTGTVTSNLSMDRKMTAGETIAVYFFQNSGVNQTVLANYTVFSGHRVY
ncbi:MAG: Head domain of trimeric autotransporter adhesin [Ferruginibacter sp.]|nr:Head domain of trimeric autotransporter adhesin [Ferruginibacter sp.]